MSRAVSVIDAYTMKVAASWPSVKLAAQELEIPESTIYQSICLRHRVYEAYFCYDCDLAKFKPAERVFHKVNGLKNSKRLTELVNKL